MEPPLQPIILPNEAWFAPMSRWQQRKEKSKIVLISLLLDYAENTTLHGLRYTTEKGRMLFEKLFWLLTFLVSLGFALFLTYNVWYKWKSSPVIVSFSEKLIPVEMIPFPSLTICPQIKVRPSVYNITEKVKYFYGDVFKNIREGKDLEALTIAHLDDTKGIKDFIDTMLVCPVPEYVPIEFTKMLPAPDTTDHSTVETIKKVAPTKACLRKCFWLGVEHDCQVIFDTVLTEEGVCFNFNGMAAIEIFSKNIQKNYTYTDATRRMSGWSWKTGYIDNSSTKTRYPFAGKSNKRSPTFEVLLSTPSTEYDKFCNAINKGFKVYIQHPASQPQSSVYSYALLPEQVSALALKINVMNTSESLQSYKPETRQCYFNHERRLHYFNVYTSSNCLLECMSNYTFKACGCVSFHMPRNDSQSICTIKKEECIRRTRVSQDLLDHIDKECSCLPNCNFITYEPEILKTQFDYKISVQNLLDIMDMEKPEYINNNQYSKLEVYFKDPNYVSIVRSELFGLTDFFANIGGLLGLFMGFSLLSFVELVYFFTIRYGLALKNAFKEKQEAHAKTSSMKVFNVENGKEHK